MPYLLVLFKAGSYGKSYCYCLPVPAEPLKRVNFQNKLGPSVQAVPWPGSLWLLGTVYDESYVQNKAQISSEKQGFESETWLCGLSY